MCDVCAPWKAKQITAKEAMNQIGLLLKNADAKQSEHLMNLSSKILDHEVPMTERNADADHKWWDAHHPEPKEE